RGPSSSASSLIRASTRCCSRVWGSGLSSPVGHDLGGDGGGERGDVGRRRSREVLVAEGVRHGGPPSRRRGGRREGHGSPRLGHGRSPNHRLVTSARGYVR